VEEADGDLMGDSVNIAARLEGIAAPGAICLSEDAYRQVKGRIELEVSDLGPKELRNIAEPVRVYLLRVGQLAPSKPGPAPASEMAACTVRGQGQGSVQFRLGRREGDRRIGHEGHCRDGVCRCRSNERVDIAGIDRERTIVELARLRYIWTRRAAEGIGRCEHALELDRNLANAHALIGYGKLFVGHAEETEFHIAEALRLSPRDPGAFTWMSYAGMSKNTPGVTNRQSLGFGGRSRPTQIFPIHIFTWPRRSRILVDLTRRVLQ
jgi:hypothetical protein